MKNNPFNPPSWVGALVVVSLAALGSSRASAQAFTAGDILVSSSTYSGDASTVTVGQALPGGGTATADGSYGSNTNGVFTNDTQDASFGVTSPITITQLTTTGANTGVQINLDQSVGVTSFASKSELAMNLSTDGSSITFMAYKTTANQLDVSNSNTPGITEPGNKDTAPATYREVVQLNANGSVTSTTTNAYAGNNGRAAVLNSATGQYLTVGNAGNGSGSDAVTAATGAQIVTAGQNATASTPGTTQAGSYSVTQNGYTADKTAKDNNFRGLTVFNNTEYVTKGSGSNGINTVYQVGTTGTLPTGSGNTISVLPGFPTTLAKGTNPSHPFGLYFANATTLYVSDEGTGLSADIGTAANAAAGIGKWSLVNGTWKFDYNMTFGLNIGTNYTVSGTNGGVSGSYTAATDGVRNITGKVNADGTVTLIGVTSTTDSNASNDAGADPNALISVTDVLGNTDATVGSTEAYSTLETAQYGQVLRGVSFTPQAVPEPSTWAMLITALLGVAGMVWKRRQVGQA